MNDRVCIHGLLSIAFEMGGAVSSGEDNADLVDKLVDREYIKDPLVERVFRAVDRGEYFVDTQKSNAYKDQAWKLGNVHLSAPCIYAEVMEWLKLGPGMGFLNLGSGTGYLSTMAGLIIGPYGMNHGVEYHQDVIDYAEERLEHFIKTSEAFDEFEFCEPSFVCGNCLLISPTHQRYDRIYCGAAVPPMHETYMKNLMKVDGILVMPLNDQLIQVKRTSETEWETKMIIPVSFARLITPSSVVEPDAEFQSENEGAVRLRFELEVKPKPIDLIELPEPKIMSLLELSRLVIRRVLLRNIRTQHPSVSRKRPRKSKKKRQPPAKQRRINFVPMDTGLMFVGQFSDDSDWENSREVEEPQPAEVEQRGERPSARDLSWEDQLRNTLFTRLFGGGASLMPSGLGGQQAAAGTEAAGEIERDDATQSEVNENSAPVDQDDSEVEATDELMCGIDCDERGSREVPTDKPSGTLTVETAGGKCVKQVDLQDVVQDRTCPISSEVAAATIDPAPVTDPSMATDVAATDAVAMASHLEETGQSSATDQSASYSSGVETFSSVDADSVDAENLSSIFWTREFQSTSHRPDRPATSDESSQAHRENQDDEDAETEASLDNSSPTLGFERRQIFNQLFDAACSNFDSDLLKKPVRHRQEEEEDEEEEEEDEPMEDAGEGTSEPIVTCRMYLQKNVELLPVPSSLKNFLLFYRN